MATFYNQATLSFGGRVTNSNITEGEVVTRVSLTKIAVTTDYGPGDNIVYAVTLVNADTVDKAGISITDDLGAYTLPGGIEVVPLAYVTGSVIYYQNGVLQPAPTVTAGTPLNISGITIPAGGSAIILYEAKATEYAPLSAGSGITNRVTAAGGEICDDLVGEATVPIRNEANLTIAKSVCPATVTCGNEVTYTFIIQNMGNTEVVATDDLIVTDLFTPALTGVGVTLNGTPLTLDTDYTYTEATGQFATLPGAITVPAASFTRNPETGVVTTTPGVAVITVTGMI